ncbi:MAG: PGF-pre-PGF domain-containing protein [Methanosarcinaceae archaeon]|nr:PGF-pre-PGF domain-containing protein [Methanosarcinaceae archaeon]
MQIIIFLNNQYLMRRPCFTVLLILMLSLLAGAAPLLSSPDSASASASASTSASTSTSTSAPEASVITASRNVSAERVYPGESFSVTVRIRALQALEASTLNEDLPVGWNVAPFESDGAVFLNTDTFKKASQEWVWAERLFAGEEKTVVYKITVPEDAEFKNYGISGEVSAYAVPAVSVEGRYPAIEVIMPSPVADFSATPLSGNVPLSVQFEDLSLYEPESWEWDFNGDGIVDSPLQNPLFTFNTAGNYNVSLKVFRGEFNDTETKTGYVTVNSKTSPVKSSGSGGGSGGGGGGSPEPNSNIELKEIANQQVFKGTRTRYTFRAEANDITAIEFDPKKSFGKTGAMIESLKNTSSLVPAPPFGQVYRNMNIWVGNSGFSSPENLENAKISFRVNRTWINENNIELSTIALVRFSEENWNSLPTEQMGEDTEYFYFEAETPGFSPFAITGSQETSSQSTSSQSTSSQSTSSQSTSSQSTSSQSTSSQGTGPDTSQVPDGGDPSSSGTGVAGEENGASGTGTKDKFKSIPGFEVLPLELCLLLYWAAKRKN